MPLEAWRIHNQAILNFCREYPERCVLGHIRTLTADLERSVATCAQKRALPLEGAGLRSLYHVEELAEITIPPEALARLTRLAPQVAALYGQLEQIANLSDAALTRATAVYRDSQATANNPLEKRK